MEVTFIILTVVNRLVIREKRIMVDRGWVFEALATVWLVAETSNVLLQILYQANTLNIPLLWACSQLVVVRLLPDTSSILQHVV